MGSFVTRIIFGLSTIGILIPFPLSAITVLECVDSSGQSSFRDTCPPEMKVKSTRRIGGAIRTTDLSVEEIAKGQPVVLFTAPDCDACDLVRQQLKGRKIPFAEKDASTDAAIQAELSAVTEGSLTVPTVTVGKQKFTGYNKHQLDSALSDAGYP